MIFIASGTQKFQFNRLLRLVDELVAKKQITEEVFAQTGNSDYKPQNYKVERFLSKEEFENMIKRCDVLLTHGGVATITTGLKYEKKVIVVPRLAKYGEHVDDHQVQIAEAFSKKNLVMMYLEEDNLADLLSKVKKHDFFKYISKREQMIETIRAYLNGI